MTEQSIEERRINLEQQKLSQEFELSTARLDLERRQAGRFSGGMVTIIGALIAVASAVATSTIGGLFGLQTTSKNNDAQFQLQQEEVRGQLATKKLEVEGQIEAQRLAAQAERDRLEIQQKFEIIVQATKGLPPETASENLKFFVEAGILDDPDGKILGLVKEGKAPEIPAPQPIEPDTSQSDRKNPLLERLAAIDKSSQADGGSSAFRIENGLVLGTAASQVAHIETVAFTEKKIDPRYIVLHYTGGVGDSTIRFLTGKQARGSAHLLVRRDGTVIQLLPLDLRAWHAGRSSWGSLVGLNGHAVAIEFENWGRLRKEGGQWNAFGRPVPDAEVLVASHKSGGPEAGWHKFTEAQIRAATALVSALAKSDSGLVDLIGHDDISPGRKLDPGPAFPIEDIREKVFGRRAALAPPE